MTPMRSALGATAFAILTGALGAQSFPDLHDSAALGPGVAPAPLVELRALDDVDGDGVSDLAVRAQTVPQEEWRILSAATGTLLHALPRGVVDATFGLTAFRSVGDVDGDGRADLLRIAPSAVPVYSTSAPANYQMSMTIVAGDDGAPIMSGTVGTSLPPGSYFTHVMSASLDDLDGDGVRDLGFVLNVGYPWALTGVEYRSATSGALIFSTVFSGPIGTDIADVGDVDGDGVGDVLVCAENSPFVAPSAGGASLMSGATLQYLRFWNGAAANQNFGNGLVVAGDLDGDGVPDMVMSSRRGSVGDHGYTAAYSGADGSTLWLRPNPVFLSYAQDALRVVKHRPFDWNGDGVLDLVQRADAAGIYGERILSGADGGELLPFGPPRTVIGDVNGDLIPEYASILPTPAGFVGPAGPNIVRVSVHKGVSGHGAGSGTLAAGWAPVPAAPTQGHVVLNGGTPGGGVAIAGSLAPTTGTIGPIGAPLLIDPGQIVFLADVHLDATGSYMAYANLGIPWLAGVIVYYQVAEYVSGETSNGFVIRFDA